MKFLLMTLMLFMPLAHAQTFQAPLTATKWQVIESPLECTLSQAIAGYGTAQFSRMAGEEISLSFSSHSYPATQSNIHFEIAQALWQNSNDRLPLKTLPSNNNQTLFTLKGQLAKDALTHIQEGRFPTIRYRSNASDQEISALLSTVHLSDSMPAFQHCLENLHPDKFSDIQKLTVYFESEQSNLSPKSALAINKIASYVKIDSSIKRIIIRGYTDNHGRKRLNIPLSEARAVVIKKHLMEQGDIDESLITTSFHREYSPVKTNKTSLGRANNRRAEIEVIR